MEDIELVEKLKIAQENFENLSEKMRKLSALIDVCRKINELKSDFPLLQQEYDIKELENELKELRKEANEMWETRRDLRIKTHERFGKPQVEKFRSGIQKLSEEELYLKFKDTIKNYDDYTYSESAMVEYCFMKQFPKLWKIYKRTILKMLLLTLVYTE